ncbi:MAG: MFS transporter [Desulfomonilia bacterium]|nr:MFS transporter [Desulfomonilia bacterium]
MSLRTGLPVTGKFDKFFVILAANFFFFLNFSQLLLLPKFIVHLGFTPKDIGLVMASFSFSVLATLPLVGIISEKMPRRWMFVFGSVLMFLPTYLYTLVEDMGPCIFGLRILQGVGFASAFGVSATMVFESVPQTHRKFLLGVLTASNISTHAIGPVFGEYMIHAFGFFWFFSSAAFLGGLSCLTGLFLPADGGKEAPAATRFTAAIPSLGAAAVLGAVFGSTIIFLPPFLMSEGIGNSSPFFVCFVTGSVVVWAVLFRFMNRLNERMLWFVAVALMVALPASFVGTFTMKLLWVLSLFFGIGYGYLYPSLNASIMDAVPTMRGVGNSLFVWAFNLGMLLASLGFGYLSDLFGYTPAFVMTAVVGLFLLVVPFTASSSVNQ